MPSPLSPSESLGLAGAALEARVRRATAHVSDKALARIAERLAADARTHDMLYDHEGKAEVIRIMLRPLIAMPEQLTYVHHVCLDLIEALERLPHLYLEDPRIREIIAVTDEEESWLREMWTEDHRRLNPIYGRLDAVCDFAAQSWQSSLKFMEPNLSGVGGINYSPVADELVMRDCVPAFTAHDPSLRIERPADQRDLFVQLLIDHARAIGRPRANLCFIEPKYEEDGPDEQSALSRHLSARYGLTIAHADPRELSVKKGEADYRDIPIDIAYRDYETRELIALEHELGRPLEGMRLLFKGNRVVSSLSGDFDHKSCWEILTDESLAERYFSADERRLFRRHVLWTRVVGDRRTLLPHGAEGDLLEFARRHREELVLKPNRAYGGSGVAIGAGLWQEEWERLLDEAAENYRDPLSSWVLQSATPLPVSEFPVVGEDGRVEGAPFYVVMGFAPTDNGLGVMCRVSQKQVVNVAQHGGMASVLLGHPPADLSIPRRSREALQTPAAALRTKIAELVHLDRAIAALEWDEEVAMPDAGRADRGDQLATLAGLRHQLLVSDALSDLIEEVQASGAEEWSRELDLLRRQRRMAISCPEDLVRRFANARAQATGAWEHARSADDFKVFAPALGELVALVRERAQAQVDGGEPYDALIDEYEPGMTCARLEPVLSDLRARLAPWVAKLADGAPPQKDLLAGRKLPESERWKLCYDVLTAIGFDRRRGKLDVSTHPFTAILGFGDVRLTMRSREDLTNSVLTILHEGGHALYDQGYPAEDRETLLGDAPSMGMHEGQARLWENHVGRSAAFWRYLVPRVRDALGKDASGLDAESLYRSVNRVSRGTVRTSADEMSYHLHIAMRFELERELVSGSLGVKDLKAAWDERSLELLGAAPESDLVGVLQDGHWAAGMFGYFPTYTLGSLYAAQLVEAYARTHSFDDEIARGQFNPLLSWLRENIHQLGNRFSAEEVITRATDAGLDAGAFLRYLEQKFGT
jgi:carboxypeptidase Taq